MAHLRHQIAAQRRHEGEYLAKAVRAKSLGDEQMLASLKAQIRRTYMMRHRFERALLVLDTAVQTKDQVESFEAFGQAIAAVGKSIEQAYGLRSLLRTQQQYELAMANARTIEQRIDVFLESTLQSMDVWNDEEPASLPIDTELDRLIEDSVQHSAAAVHGSPGERRELERDCATGR